MENSLLLSNNTNTSLVYGTKIRHFNVTTKYFCKKSAKKMKLMAKVKV